MYQFVINNKSKKFVHLCNFRNEKYLQEWFESKLESHFGCIFFASQYNIGPKCSGRIDTIALTKENRPIIIEYKKKISSTLISQSLCYLSLIKDYRDEFEAYLIKKFNNRINVNWDQVGVVCLAPGYKKYDLDAVKTMSVNIELWQYSCLDASILHLEKIYGKDTFFTSSNTDEFSITPNNVETVKNDLNFFKQYNSVDAKFSKDIVSDLSIKNITSKCNKFLENDKKINFSIFRLSKTSQIIIDYLYINRPSKDENFSEKINQIILSNRLNLNPNTVKTALRRLVEKNYLSLIQSKRGVNGWVVYSINSLLFTMYKELSKSEMNIKDYSEFGYFYDMNKTKLKIKNDFEHEIPKNYLKLSELDKCIADYIFDQCFRNNSLFTGPIYISDIANFTGRKSTSIRSSIKKLRKLFCLDRVDYKDGKAGWTRYKLHKKFYIEILFTKSIY